ncbi:MAG: HAD family phosphatase, partial [Candidatus Hadarchaeota archaeon]|nr:HAD family phosphatase [Candidatus Hadarchaeota archaeon]
GFDCGGVLLTDSWDPERISEKFDIPTREIWRRTWENIKPLERGRISEEDFLKKVLKGHEFSLEEVKREIRSRMRVLFPENFDLIRKLRGKYDLALMNNECKEWNLYRVSEFKLDEFFDHAFSSCDLGVAKPDEGYYREVLRGLGVEPGDLVFIDNTERNVASAEKLGVRSLRFESSDQLKGELTKLGVRCDF